MATPAFWHSRKRRKPWTTAWKIPLITPRYSHASPCNVTMRKRSLNQSKAGLKPPLRRSVTVARQTPANEVEARLAEIWKRPPWAWINWAWVTISSIWAGIRSCWFGSR